MEKAGTRKFAVLLCADESEHVKQAYGGYLKVFMGLLGEEDETWRVYRAMHGELPCMADVHTYDGFVITGSCSDAHGDDRWINDLVSFLRALDSMKKKVLGVCFGHQILSRALGGKTGRAMKGWDIGVTCIRLSPSAIKLLSSLHIPSHLPIIECHRDEVWQPPPHAEVMACSEKTGVEMFRYGDHMMGIQGHPEYNKDILRHLLDRLLQRNLIQACQAETAKASLEAQEPDREAWKRLCRGFLTGKLSW
ncbi:Homoserine O-succinyltransferase [Musa troglodytarum]|uniref:Homoserine O-succinyltransferase n=2 Tax=Musa troglodytarum TaxID=320322 RepID=A0A9E7HDZ5_9LILI|nr:Homoserine O-succinyltransferase [Musa troglodytarum]